MALFKTLHSKKNRFLIGREKPGTQSEVARLISETLEQEKNQQQQQQHLDDHFEHSTEEVSQLVMRKPLLSPCSTLCRVHVRNGKDSHFVIQLYYIIVYCLLIIKILYTDNIALFLV